MDQVSDRSSADMEKRSHTSGGNGLSPSEELLEKRVWTKLDIWILPVVTMFYFLSWLVRIVLYAVFESNVYDSLGPYQPGQCQGGWPTEGAPYDQQGVQYRLDCHLRSIHHRRTSIKPFTQGPVCSSPCLLLCSQITYRPSDQTSCCPRC